MGYKKAFPQIVTYILQKAFFKHALEPGPVKRTEPAGHTASKNITVRTSYPDTGKDR